MITGLPQTSTTATAGDGKIALDVADATARRLNEMEQLLLLAAQMNALDPRGFEIR